MEIILTFFAGMLWYDIIGLVILSAISYYSICDRNGYAIIIIVGIFYFYYINVFEIVSVFYFMCVYLMIGFIWSLYRTRALARKLTDKNNKEKESNKLSRSHLMDEIKSKSNTSYWILSFPLDILEYLFSDVFDYVLSKLHRIYDAIIKSYVNVNYKDL